MDGRTPDKPARVTVPPFSPLPRVTAVLVASFGDGEDATERWDFLAGGTTVADMDYSPAWQAVEGFGVEDGFRGQGYGRASLAAFFRANPGTGTVWGESLPDVGGFWTALGCRWTDPECRPEDGDYARFELDRTAVLGD